MIPHREVLLEVLRQHFKANLVGILFSKLVLTVWKLAS